MAQNDAQNAGIRYLNPPTVEVRKKKYCRFKKAGIKYVDYKDPSSSRSSSTSRVRSFPVVSPVLPSSSRGRLPRPSKGPAPSLCFLMSLTFLNNRRPRL